VSIKGIYTSIACLSILTFSSCKREESTTPTTLTIISIARVGFNPGLGAVAYFSGLTGYEDLANAAEFGLCSSFVDGIDFGLAEEGIAGNGLRIEGSIYPRFVYWVDAEMRYEVDFAGRKETVDFFVDVDRRCVVPTGASDAELQRLVLLEGFLK
jgi:hypothetical protein